MVDEPSSLGEAVMLGAGSIDHRELIYYTVSKSTTFEPGTPVWTRPLADRERADRASSDARKYGFILLYIALDYFATEDGLYSRLSDTAYTGFIDKCGIVK